MEVFVGCSGFCFKVLEPKIQSWIQLILFLFITIQPFFVFFFTFNAQMSPHFVQQTWYNLLKTVLKITGANTQRDEVFSENLSENCWNGAKWGIKINSEIFWIA